VIGPVRRRPLSTAGLTLAISLSVLAASARTEGSTTETSPGRVTEGTLLWRTVRQETPVPAPPLQTDVRMVVTGIVARAKVVPAFSDPSDEWAEGIYVFPLPEDAAVDHRRMTVGDRVIEGVVQARAEARARYEQAKHAGRRASLIEQERRNIFTTSVANIPPGATITVALGPPSSGPSVGRRAWS
jgi:Ca-activated chloride channel family protein